MAADGAYGLGFADYEMTPGEHICALYETAHEQMELAVPYARVGLQHRQRVVFLGRERVASALLEGLAAKRVPVQQHVMQGDVLCICREAAFRPHGTVEPAAILGLAREVIRDSLASGWSLVRFVGDYAWLLGSSAQIDRWLSYEARADHQVTGWPSLALRLYDQTRLPDAFRLRLLHTHTVVAVGGELRMNHVLLPPDHFLTTTRRLD